MSFPRIVWRATSLLIILVLSVAAAYSASLFSVIPSAGTVNYSGSQGIIFEDGFESGDFSAWYGVVRTTGETASVSQINPFEGYHHAVFSTEGSASGMEQAFCNYHVVPGRDEIFARAYFYIVEGLPLNDNNDRFGLLTLRDLDSGWMTLNLRIQRVGGVEKFFLIATSGLGDWATITTDEIYPEMNTWYSIEIYFKVHPTDGEARVWINGVEYLTLTGQNTASFGSTDRVRFGLISVNVQHPVTVYVDTAAIGSSHIGSEIILEDGFESGGFDVWTSTFSSTGNSLDVIQTNPFEGLYHGEFHTIATTSGVTYAYCEKTISPGLGEVYARGYFHIAEGLPLVDNNDRFGLIGFEVEGVLTATLRVVRSDGVDRFNVVGINGVGGVQRSTDAIYPSEGRWYCLEFYIRVDAEEGEYRAWIDGVEQITITNVNTAQYGVGVSTVRFGLTYTSGVQHDVKIYGDCAAISSTYVGAFVGPRQGSFGIIGLPGDVPSIRNFIWLFGNQSIQYTVLRPSEVSDIADIDQFDGLVVWTTTDQTYNAEAVRQFARTRTVISHVRDFCNVLYPSLSGSMIIVSTSTVTYVKDWGNFRNGDLVEMRNETGNKNQLTTVQASSLTYFSNVTQIARYSSTRIALFHMEGINFGSGFYVMDLHATTPETEWIGIWHLFPAIKTVMDFPTGKYARWMGYGQEWWSLTQVYNHIDTLVSQNRDIAEKWSIGTSVEGRNIPAIVIGKGAKIAIIDGSMHGVEKTGTFACLRIAELLLEYYRSDSFWQSRLADYKVIIIPVLNPDGFVINSRYNANGVDLNRQFPEKGTTGRTTEPEAWALRSLMDNYPPTVYINTHEGWSYYPLHLLYGNHEEGANQDATLNAMDRASEAFAKLNHWGWFTEDNSHVWIGEVRYIGRAGITTMALAYASWKHGASCMLMETFLSSQMWDARKCLWGTDYYTAMVISFLQQIER